MYTTDAIPTGSQRTQVKHRTHVFGRIVRFPLTPPTAKEESPGEKGRLFYLIFFSNKERKQNTFERDGGITGVETKSTNRSVAWWGQERQKLAKDEVIKRSRGSSGWQLQPLATLAENAFTNMREIFHTGNAGQIYPHQINIWKKNEFICFLEYIKW